MPGLLLLWSLGGCLPPAPAPPDAPPVAREALFDAFDRDQAARRRQSRRWRVEGILDAETAQWRGRNRFDLAAEGAQRGRLTIHGPMGRVGVILTTRPEGMRLVDPAARRVVDAPADATGLARLTGIPLDPSRLLGLLPALVADPALRHPAPAGVGVTAVRSGAEQLWLDGRGRLLRRAGETPGWGTWQVAYQWPEEAADADGTGTPPAMPRRVTVTWQGGERVDLILQRWRFPVAWSGAPWQVDIPEGFQWHVLIPWEGEP